LGQGASACGGVKQADVKRFALVGLVAFAVLACAACGGGSKQAAGSRALPPSLVKQIQAAVRRPSPIGGASSVKTVEVYGPASHSALERASLGPTSETQHVAGAWYLIVLRGHFTPNLPQPPGAKASHPRIAMEVWSPKGTGPAFGFADRLPAAVARLGGHTVVDLS